MEETEQYLFSKKDLNKLMIPLFIEQALVFTVGMFDTIMVAYAGENAVSGVSLIETINMLVNYLFAALATGGAIVAGHYLGMKEQKSANHAAKQLVIATVVFSMALMLLGLIGNEQMLSLFFGNIDSQVMGEAKIYFYITALSYPFIAIFNSAGSLFRAMGDSKTAMNNAFIMNGINIFGNAVFIYVLKWGVFGAALATLISRIVVSITMMWMLRNKERQMFIRSYSIKDFDWSIVKRILRIGIPNGVENSIFQVGKIVMTSLVAAFGTTAIAANAVGNSLTGVEVIPGMAVGLAITTVVAQCLGAKRPEQADYYVKYLMKQAYIYMILLNVAMILLLRPILSIYQLSEETFAMAYRMLLIHGIGAIIIWPFSFTLPNAFRAAGDVRAPMLISISTMWVFRIGLSYLGAYMLGFGPYSVWIAMVVDWTARAMMFSLRWKKGTWKSNHVV